jgi:hypothetical protein
LLNISNGTGYLSQRPHTRTSSWCPGYILRSCQLWGLAVRTSLLWQAVSATAIVMIANSFFIAIIDFVTFSIRDSCFIVFDCKVTTLFPKLYQLPMEKMWTAENRKWLWINGLWIDLHNVLWKKSIKGIKRGIIPYLLSPWFYHRDFST